MKFDDRLQEFFGLFHYSYKNTEDCPSVHRACEVGWPTERGPRRWVRSWRPCWRAWPRKLPAKRCCRTPTLKSAYLDRMQRELEIHRAAAGLTYPEDWWPEHQRKILERSTRGTRRAWTDCLELRGRVLRRWSRSAGVCRPIPHEDLCGLVA